MTRSVIRERHGGASASSVQGHEEQGAGPGGVILDAQSNRLSGKSANNHGVAVGGDLGLAEGQGIGRNLRARG